MSRRDEGQTGAGRVEQCNRYDVTIRLLLNLSILFLLPALDDITWPTFTICMRIWIRPERQSTHCEQERGCWTGLNVYSCFISSLYLLWEAGPAGSWGNSFGNIQFVLLNTSLCTWPLVSSLPGRPTPWPPLTSNPTSISLQQQTGKSVFLYLYLRMKAKMSAILFKWFESF